jgi:hypothetical protein
MDQVREAVRVAADILETLGPTARAAVQTRVERLERCGHHEAGEFWRLVARAMRRLAARAPAEDAPRGPPRASWAIMQEVERLFREAEQLEAQAQASLEPLRAELIATAARRRGLAEILSREE